MFAKLDDKYITLARLGLSLAAALTALVLLWPLPKLRQAHAQENPPPAETGGPSAQEAPEAASLPATAAAPSEPKDRSINVFELALAGGIFMIPIAAMSVLAVTMTIERFLGLRRQRVLPDGFVAGLGQLSAGTSSFDPRKAYRLCQQFPSAAASVVRVMLLKVGRPLPEVEAAVAHASQREADRLYANVRWLNLAASLSTLLGLIGTIQGMIMAFHRLTIMDAAADRTNVLADGIYTALVTTFAGLAVAIPALLFAHFFEGRIQSIFRQIDELIFSLLPQVERYEGRVRFSRQAEGGNGEAAEEPDAPPIRAGATDTA